MEIWKDIPNLPDYQASNLGRIRSGKCGGHTKNGSWRIICSHPEPTAGNYLKFMSFIEGRRIKKYVHRCVIEAFRGPPPHGTECCHDDGNPHNNKIDNLYWGTRLQNIRQNFTNGTFSLGSKHYLAKLDESKVSEIKARIAAGEKDGPLSAMFGVSPAAICNIRHGKSWKHVKT